MKHTIECGFQSNEQLFIDNILQSDVLILKCEPIGHIRKIINNLLLYITSYSHLQSLS